MPEPALKDRIMGTVTVRCDVWIWEDPVGCWHWKLPRLGASGGGLSSEFAARQVAQRAAQEAVDEL